MRSLDPSDLQSERTEPSTRRPADPAAEPKGPTIPVSQDEAPDRDTPSWTGAEPEDAVGLVDPRHEIPNPPGL